MKLTADIFKKAPWFSLMIFTCSNVIATTIVVENNDGPGEGFNDTTDAVTLSAQKGNNPGTTLGEMRLKLFEDAANVWQEILYSPSVITISANFDSLSCEQTGALLGRATATSSHADFNGSEPGVAYIVALAESISRTDLNGGAAEITAVFNSDVDADDNCLGDKGFYYGTDGNAPQGSIPLFPAVLHELAHGLGFTSLADVGPDGTGEFVSANGYPDSFSRNLLDLESGKSWDEMDNAERKNSALNGPNLVWKGPKTNTDRNLHLATAPALIINTPSSIAGEFEVIPGEEPLAIIPPGGVSGDVVDGNSFEDLDGNLSGGCKQFHFSAPFTGKIVLLDAADCGAFAQARWAQVEGAAGVIIAAPNDDGFSDLSGKYIENGASIPYVGVKKFVGTDLRASLETPNVTIGFATNMFAGDNQGMLKMYAPSTYHEDTSVSHWSNSAFPHLLMQPFLGPIDSGDVDLTAAALKDIGWQVNIPGEPPIIILKDGFED